MVNIRQVQVNWVTQSGPGKVSVFNFSAAGASITAQRDALRTMLEVLDSNLVPGTTWSIENAGRVLDDATGALTGAWSDGAAITGAGGAAGQPVADATQVLLQWQTGVIEGGRFLRGRTFIPGLNRDYTNLGNLSTSIVTTWGAALTTFVGSSTGFGIWRRPWPGSVTRPAYSGAFQAASTGDVWPELAVQRRRRG